MNDRVIFADIVVVAEDLAVVRLPRSDGGILGICRMPSAALMPAGVWFSAVDGKTLPLIAHQSDHGLVMEVLISGKPLLVTILETSAPSLSREDYPWDAWNGMPGHYSWSSHLAHGTHFLVGGMVVAFLLIAIAARRKAARGPVRPGSAVTLGTMSRSAFGGLLGFGRDSFTCFPLPPGDRESSSL